MVQSNAETVGQYLAELPEDRRAAIECVRAVILRNLPKGYEEQISFGMISYEVPLETYPDTYNGKPLMVAGLANQKNNMAIYLSAVYSDEEVNEWFRHEYLLTGKRFDMGKSCVRFKKIDDLPVDLIGEAIARVPMKQFLATHEAAMAERESAKKSK
ncbi:hypothetical protein GQR58_030502 [Nymphon striatum]|nr:hypothetical protein GQR58_030502 [Nymphon striatum]